MITSYSVVDHFALICVICFLRCLHLFASSQLNWFVLNVSYKIQTGHLLSASAVMVYVSLIFQQKCRIVCCLV